MGDKAAIDQLTKRFYSLFTNRDGTVPNVAAIHDLFIPEGVIVKTCGETPVVYDLAGFVEPRARILCDGTLTDFEEAEVQERTVIAGSIAQRVSLYHKSGVLNGEPFEARGIKTLQFIRADGAWKIVAVSWDDEREGFVPALE